MSKIVTSLNLLMKSPEKFLQYYGRNIPDQHTLPHFFGIGAQKGGTTWLHENLICHPSIFLPPERQLNFFSDKFENPLKEYQAAFAGKEHFLRGEINPDYGILEKWKIEYLAKILPNLKSIMILRNPIERAWSHAIMSYVKMHNKKPDEITLDDWLRHFKNPLSVIKGNYPRILKKWRSVYPEEQIKVVFHDELCARPQAFLEDVFKFLNVEIPENFLNYPIEKKINSGAKIAMPEKAKEALKERYRDDIYELHNQLGTPIQKWIAAYDL